MIRITSESHEPSILLNSDSVVEESPSENVQTSMYAHCSAEEFIANFERQTRLEKKNLEMRLRKQNYC